MAACPVTSKAPSSPSTHMRTSKATSERVVEHVTSCVPSSDDAARYDGEKRTASVA